MAATAPLIGSELIDCARANGKKGVEIAAERCGYLDVPSFEAALHAAGEHIGVEINSFTDLIKPPSNQPAGVEIAPDSSGQL